MLDDTTLSIQRDSYDIFDVSGTVGGISQVFVGIAGFLILPISQLAFKIEAILLLFKVSSSKKIKKMGNFGLIR